MPYGLSEVQPVSSPGQTPAPIQVTFNSPYGETFWDFLQSSSTLTPLQAASKYKLAIGLGAAGLIGFALFFRTKGGT